MPLDPLLKSFLDEVNAQPGPKMWELSAPEARQTFVALMEMAGPKDVAIGKTENMTVPGPGGDIPIRIYTPVAAGGDPLPALVYFHGGGWVIGNIETHDGLCRMFANEGGLRVIAVDYRLAPEHRYPAAVEDAFAAAAWVEANASKLGVDPNRIAVGGDSAGGGLAAAVCLMARAKGAPHIAFQMLLFPVTHIGANTPSMNDFASGYFLERKSLEWFYDHYVPDADARAQEHASPLLAKDASGLPPAYIVVAGFDPLHDEGVQYAKRLRDAGVKVTLKDYPDLVHCFFYLQAILPQALEAVKTASSAIREALA